MATLGRRAFLFLASLFAPVARLRGAVPQPVTPAPAISVDEFLRLSQRLLGRSRLDAQIAATYLKALRAVPGEWCAPGAAGARERSGVDTGAHRARANDHRVVVHRHIHSRE